MFAKLLIQLAVVCGAICTVIPKPDLSVPISGTYRIQNAQTGLFLDASGFGVAPGTPVIVQTLNEPLTSNQEWTLAVNSDGQSGTLKSVINFVALSIDPSQGLVIALNSIASDFQIVPVDGGVLICSIPSSFGCLTSPSDPLTQIPVQSRTGHLNQVWVFEIIG
ncbi:hypothetical protein QCA50_004747 [Cerrena zonata]|uniref:Ricin B lectin domain-containing protein n=1 Tax=Cerrena zonata TaxID=2478898 RepID=A0AAW0GPB6_9APHY